MNNRLRASARMGKGVLVSIKQPTNAGPCKGQAKKGIT